MISGQSPLSPDLLSSMNPYAAGVQAVGAALSGGTSSATTGDIGDTGTGLTFNISGPGGSSAGGGVLSGQLLGVPAVLWAGVLGIGALLLIKR